MKKIITFFVFCFLLSAFSLTAQEFQLPNSSFETWQYRSEGSRSFWDFKTDFFYTLNELYVTPNEPRMAELTAFRDGNARHGSYCIKLVTEDLPVGSDLILLPGMVGTITEEFVKEFIQNQGNINKTRSWVYDTPHALEGWYKYHPVNGDSALIDIGFDNAFVEKIIIKDRVENWTWFRIPIPKQYWDMELDLIRILFVASAGVNFEDLTKCKGQKGSTLWIDNIYLNYTCDPCNSIIKQSLFSTLKANAFPNPAAEVLNIELNEHFSGKVMVYNALGSVVMEESINGTQSQLNISALASGNYTYRLMEGYISFAQGKFIVVK